MDGFSTQKTPQARLGRIHSRTRKEPAGQEKNCEQDKHADQGRELYIFRTATTLEARFHDVVVVPGIFTTRTSNGKMAFQTRVARRRKRQIARTSIFGHAPVPIPRIIFPNSFSQYHPFLLRAPSRLDRLPVGAPHAAHGLGVAFCADGERRKPCQRRAIRRHVNVIVNKVRMIWMQHV